MSESTERKFPIIRKGEGGYWHAYGKGWAVCAPSKETVEQKYYEMLNLIDKLITRPVEKVNDTL